MRPRRSRGKGRQVTEPRRAAIVGIGATEFSKNSGRSELRLVLESTTAALQDAGIDPSQVSGLVTYSSDNNDEMAVSRALGLEAVTFFARTPYGGGGGCGTVALASYAVALGVADVVICYRGMNERSQQRLGQPKTSPGAGLATSFQIDQSWVAPFGMGTPAANMAQSARRYMHQYGATSEDFGRVAVAFREWAVTNPRAWFHQKPITLADHQASRMVADPLHLLDCCQESDGSVAVVVTSLERARDCRQASVAILAAAQGIGPDQVGMTTLYRDNIAFAEETAVVGRQIWGRSGLGPQDMDLAVIYDHFSPAVLMQLEALGFCGPGEAPAFIHERGIGPGGSFPVNPNGGQLSEAYIHGFNGIAEAVRQLRGTAVNQVDGACTAVVTSGSHVPTSGMVLGRAS
jgi:acetyl-CoA acetyltransferase